MPFSNNTNFKIPTGITLGEGEFIAAKAGTNSAIVCTILSSNIIEGTIGTLFQGQLTTSVVTLYTSTDVQTIIGGISLANITASSVSGIIFYINGSATANQIIGGLTIPANGSAVFSEGLWQVYDSSGFLQYVGATGPQGAQGIQGIQGIQGPQGNAGEVPNARQVIAGAGLTGGGDLSADRTFDVVANPDGSIVVAANDVKVGVLATDAQHGGRGGGNLHSNATTTVAGFMSPGDKQRANQAFDAVADFGFVGDLVTVFDGAVVNTLNTLTCATSAPFAVGDVGKRVTVARAGASGAQLTTTITGFTSSSIVTLAATAGATLSALGTSFGTDNTTAITNMQNQVNNAVFPGVKIVFPHSVTNSYGFPTKVLFNKTVQLEGIGGGHTADTGDYTKIGGTRLAWWGTSSDSGTAFTSFFTITPIGVQSIKRPALRHCWLDCRNGDQNQALYGLKLASCHGLMIEDFFIMDALATGLWTDISSTPTEAQDTTRFSIKDVCFRQLDNPTGAITTPITTTTAITLTTSGQTLTVITTAGFPTAGYIWAATNLGYPALVNYTGLTGTTFTGCTVSAEQAINAPATVSGSNIVQAVPGNGGAIFFDGGSGANSCCGIMDMVQISHGTTWGVSGISFNNSDSIISKQVMINGGNATNDGAINRIRKPGVRINGSNTSDTLASRNNVFIDGDPGAGGVSVMGVLNTGARLLAMAQPNYWDRMQMGNGAPIPVVEGNAYFDWNPNGGFRAGQRGAASVADQAVTAATLTSLTGSLLTVPPQGFQVGTTFRWTFCCTKTAAGTAANSFFIKIGTAGTTADGTVATFTTGLGTAVVDTGRVEILMTLRTLGAAATATAQLQFGHNLAATGFLVIPAATINGTMATFNSTTAKQYINVCLTSGASTVFTFQSVQVEVINPANP